MALIDIFQLALLHKFAQEDALVLANRSNPPPMPVTTRAKAAASNRAAPPPPPISNLNRDFTRGLTPIPNGVSIMQKQEPDTEETKKPTISKYERYIIQDFDSHRIFVDMEVFMKRVLHVPDNWEQEWADIIREIRNDNFFQSARLEYNARCEKSGSNEQEFYEPLVRMVNAVFNCISLSKKVKPKTRLRCLRNDPRKILGGMMSELVPDIVTVHEDFFNEISEKEKKEQRLTDTNLTWAHPLQMIEVKPGGNLLIDGSQMPRLMVNDKDPKEGHAKPHVKVKTAADSGRPEGDAASDIVLGTNLAGTKRSAEEPDQAGRKSQKTQPHSTAGGEQPVVEVPTVETDRQKETYLQVGRYLLEQFSVPAFRSHATIGLVDRDRIQFYHANHSAILVSSAISFSTRKQTPDLEKFIAIVIAFSQLSLRDSGILHNIQGTKLFADNQKLPTSRFLCAMEQMQQGHKLALRNGKKRMELTYGDVISHEPSLSGRGTAVLHATSPDRDGDLVVKISWPGSRRVPEDKFLKKAVAIAKSRKEHNWALNHLPRVEFSQSIDFNSGSTHGKVASLFDNAKFANGNYEYEQRTLRIIVQERLYPLKTLTDVKEIAQVLLDVACVHRWLYDKVGILHRDLSLRNIMYRRNEKGEIYGVLTDFDLSSWTVDLAKDYTRTSQQRTGTPPYMACGVLDGSDASHLYRHDVESLFYIMVMLASRYEIRAPKGGEGGVQIRQEPRKLPFDRWFDQPSYQVLADSKRCFITQIRGGLELSPTFEDFRDWLQPIRVSLRKGFIAEETHADLMEEYEHQKGKRRKALPQFDRETLGGHIHYSTLVGPALKLKGKLEGLLVRYESE